MLRLRYIAFLAVAIGWQTSSFSNPKHISVLAQNTDKQKAYSVDCGSLVPEKNTTKEYDFIKKWSNHVAIKAFSLSHYNLNNQLMYLKQCFTNSGWLQFEQALHRSGNVDLMSAHQLSSNAQVVGHIVIEQQKTKQTWTAEVPLRVVYQNKKQKISQKLNVHLLITELPDHHLGIMQIVGVPVKKPDTTQKDKTQNITIP